MVKKRRYRRIRARLMQGRDSVWMADDHLLVVTNAVTFEEYQRFYLADIQAIAMVKTRAYRVWALVLWGLAAIFAATALFYPHDRYGTLGIAAAIGVFAVLHMIAGPTCACRLQTAVHSVKLPSLRRVRAARAVVVELRRAIEAAQTREA